MAIAQCAAGALFWYICALFAVMVGQTGSKQVQNGLKTLFLFSRAVQDLCWKTMFLTIFRPAFWESTGTHAARWPPLPPHVAAHGLTTAFLTRQAVSHPFWRQSVSTHV